MRVFVVVGVSILAILLLSNFMMSTLILCSSLSGQLTNSKGEYVAGAQVERTWAWGSKNGSQETYTDEEGRFHFDKVVEKSFLARILPHEPNIEQKILVTLADTMQKEVLLLYKHDYDLNGEWEGKPLDIVCDVDAEVGANGFFYGTCRPRE